MKWTRNEILVGFVSGLLGILVGAGLMYWGRLPDHTIDLLVFTESAFGIGMTVIALIFSLVSVNQVKEIDRRFAEKSVEIDRSLSAQQTELEEFDRDSIAGLQEESREMQRQFASMRSDFNDAFRKALATTKSEAINEIFNGATYSLKQVDARLSKRLDEHDGLIQPLLRFAGQSIRASQESDDNA